MDKLEAFINRPDTSDVTPLLEAAIVHYQFETIHPFADGNGRVGRILVPLILLARGLIESAAFFLSPALERRRDEYIDRMFAVSTSGDWTSWLKFFLECCERTCETSVDVIDGLLQLQQTYRQRSMDAFQSTKMLTLIDTLFASPMISAPLVQERLGVTHRAARQIIKKLESIDIVQKIDGIGKPEYYAAREILRVSS